MYVLFSSIKHDYGLLSLLLLCICKNFVSLETKCTVSIKSTVCKKTRKFLLNIPYIWKNICKKFKMYRTVNRNCRVYSLLDFLGCGLIYQSILLYVITYIHIYSRVTTTSDGGKIDQVTLKDQKDGSYSAYFVTQVTGSFQMECKASGNSKTVLEAPKTGGSRTKRSVSSEELSGEFLREVTGPGIKVYKNIITYFTIPNTTW